MLNILNLIVCLCLGAFAAGAQARPSAPPGVLRVAINSDMRSTQFGVNRDGNTDTILHHVVESLVAYRADMSVGPLLAKQWQVSADGRSYTFTLRDGALFHNGSAVTAEDVKWSWERMLKPETGLVCRSWFDGSTETGIKIERIDALSSNSVRFTLASANPMFLPRMANIACLTGIIHRDSLDAAGKWIGPVGTGPYTIKEWRRNAFIELARFAPYRPLPGVRDGYAGNRAAQIERIRFLVIADGAAAKAALLAGDVDLLATLDLDAVDELAQQRSFNMAKNITPGWEVLLVQNRDPLLADKRIRQALASAIDRAPLTVSATRGLGKPNPSPVAPSSPYFSKDFDAALPYSPAHARALLKQAGYAGAVLKIQTNTQFPFDLKAAIMLQDMLKKAGFNAELEILDWATQFKNYNDGRYQLMIMGLSARADPGLLMEVFIGNKAKRKNVALDLPGVSAILAASALETDDEKRRALFKSIHQAMVDDSSIIGLFNYVEVDALSKRVKGYAPWPLGKPRFWGVSLAR